MPTPTPYRTHRMRAIVCGALAASATFLSSPNASADEVSPTGKGIVGCALLGGELVVFGEAIFGVRSSAAYLIGAGVGAAGGGVGGFFIEKAVADGQIPAYLLAGGLALLIPAIVVTLDQTRYMPKEGAREDRPVNPPVAEPGAPGGSSVVGAPPASAPPAPAPAPGTTPQGDSAPPSPGGIPTTPPTTPPAGGGGGTPRPRSFIDVHEGSFRMAVPVPEVRPVFSVAERKAFGVQNPGSELRFPVVRVTF